MPSIKVSSRVDPKVWKALKNLASENKQSISGALNDAIAEYVQRRRIRPVVMSALEQSIAKNRRMGELLAR